MSAPRESEPRTREEMIARARAARDRMEAAGRAHEARSAAPSRPAEAPAEPETLPDWPFMGRHARRLTLLGKISPAGIIREVARKHGVTPAEIVGVTKQRHVIAARREAIARVKDARPDLSSTRIGRIFHRDHTSILWSLKRARGEDPRANRKPAR